MATYEETVAFVVDYLGLNRELVTAGTSIQDDVGIYGDEIDAFMIAFSKRFNVNIDDYFKHWYFHTCEDGFNIGGLFFRSPDAKVDRIPITVGMLAEFAHTGCWKINYPPHKPPGFRADILINGLIAIGTIAAVITSCMVWLLGGS